MEELYLKRTTLIKMIFDKQGVCKKCQHRVMRLKRGETWHHEEYSHYLRCGAVQLKEEKCLGLLKYQSWQDMNDKNGNR